MKLAFSTLGCPDWDLSTIISKAGAFGFDGLEIRGLLQTLDVTTLPEFTSQGKETLTRLRDTNLEIACFSSSVFLSYPKRNSPEKEKHFDEIKRYIELCEFFGTKCIRIFGGSIGSRSWDDVIDEAIITVHQMDEILKNTNVKIVIETHDDWMRAEYFKQLMIGANVDSVGILWDVNHPFMFIGEEPEITWDKTGKWIYHTHWKDSQLNPYEKHGFKPCLMGEGILPLLKIFKLLVKGGYNGYFSLEWEKRWHQEIEDPEIAFPQYVTFMNELQKKANSES